jgi:hypothetical protein
LNPAYVREEKQASIEMMSGSKHKFSQRLISNAEIEKLMKEEGIDVLKNVLK